MATPNFVVYESSSKIGDIDDCDFDFVIIEKDLEGRITGDDSDDDGDSYDYCEDVCPMLSNTYHEQESRDDDSLLSLVSDDDDDLSSPTSDLKDSILTLPSALMKDLDEAHEAAKLIRITDPEEYNDLDTAPTGDDKETNGRHESQLSSSVTSPETIPVGDIAIQDSSSLAVVTGSEIAPIPTGCERPTGRTTGRTIIFFSALQHETNPTPNETTPRFLFPKQGGKHSSKDNHKNKNSSSSSVAISRTSNKKRRKQLKLLKKSHAATAAANRMEEQAASTNPSPSSPGKSFNTYLKRTSSSGTKKQINATPSRCASKKVANIAVSSAIETMANYREELSRHQGKQNQQQVVGS